MAVFLLAFGSMLNLFGTRFFRTFIPFLAFLLVGFGIYSYLETYFASNSIVVNVLVILVAIFTSFLAMVFARGLLSLLIFWIAFISAQTLVSSFLSNTANLPSFLSFLIGVIAGILALYILFFNPLSYLLGIIITSVIGAFITYISLVIILNDFDYTLSWNTLQSQSIYLIIAAMIFLAIA